MAGHSAVLQGCTVEDEAFVGMGATLLDGVIVEKHGMVAAGALVRQNTRIPSGEVVHHLFNYPLALVFFLFKPSLAPSFFFYFISSNWFHQDIPKAGLTCQYAMRDPIDYARLHIPL